MRHNLAALGDYSPNCSEWACSGLARSTGAAYSLSQREHFWFAHSIGEVGATMHGLKSTLAILAVSVALSGAVAPASAQGREAVCNATADLLVDKRRMVRLDIKDLRSQIRADGISSGLKRSLRRQLVVLRSRRQLLKVAGRRLDTGTQTTQQCRNLDTFITRVASYS